MNTKPSNDHIQFRARKGADVILARIDDARANPDRPRMYWHAAGVYVGWHPSHSDFTLRQDGRMWRVSREELEEYVFVTALRLVREEVAQS